MNCPTCSGVGQVFAPLKRCTHHGGDALQLNGTVRQIFCDASRACLISGDNADETRRMWQAAMGAELYELCKDCRETGQAILPENTWFEAPTTAFVTGVMVGGAEKKITGNRTIHAGNSVHIRVVGDTASIEWNALVAK